MTWSTDVSVEKKRSLVLNHGLKLRLVWGYVIALLHLEDGQHEHITPSFNKQFTVSLNEVEKFVYKVRRRIQLDVRWENEVGTGCVSSHVPRHVDGVQQVVLRLVHIFILYILIRRALCAIVCVFIQLQQWFRRLSFSSLVNSLQRI